MLKVGSDFSGVGAFDQALKRLKLDYKTIFACDIDKYARKTYIHNYGEPYYYPENVYDRDIPKESLDIYMTSPPCQAFSLAGKRKGEEDKRGILFYNSHEFIKINKPRYFIFENVKGLLSDDNGKTFQRWYSFLGGKSINGNPVIFPINEAVPYHLYFKVLNSKNYGVPQNRERIFIVGIRDDKDNNFRWPKEELLKLKLKDVLEDDVEEKYYLSEKMIQGFVNKKNNGFKGRFTPKNGNELHANCITTKAGSYITDNFINDSGYINQDTQASQVHSKEKVAPTISSGTHGYANGYVKIGAMRGRNICNSDLRSQQIEINKNGISNSLTTVQKDNLVIYQRGRGYNNGGEHKICPPITSSSFEHNHSINTIRRLTPRECFRLMDFPESFDFSIVSDTQAYKQAGNSIPVAFLEKIIKKLSI